MFNKIEWKRHLLITGCYENVKNTQFVTKYIDIYIGVHFSIEESGKMHQAALSIWKFLCPCQSKIITLFHLKSSFIEVK
jgi:hypothetical protein